MMDQAQEKKGRLGFSSLSFFVTTESTWQMQRNVKFLYMTDVENMIFLHICLAEKCEISPHPSCGENSYSPHLSCGENSYSPHLSCGQMWNYSTSTMWRQIRFSISVMWRNLSFLHMMDVEQFQIYPNGRCGEIWNFSTWQIFSPQVWPVIPVTNIMYVESIALPLFTNSELWIGRRQSCLVHSFVTFC